MSHTRALLTLPEAHEHYDPVLREWLDRNEVRIVVASELVDEVWNDLARANKGRVRAVSFDRYLTAVTTRMAKSGVG